MSSGMGMASPPLASPPIQPAQARPPPGWSSGVMQPSVAKPTWNAAQAAKTDWGDFDPLK
jgi:SCY1-like protein 2